VKRTSLGDKRAFRREKKKKKKTVTEEQIPIAGTLEKSRCRDGEEKMSTFGSATGERKATLREKKRFWERGSTSPGAVPRGPPPIQFPKQRGPLREAGGPWKG